MSRGVGCKAILSHWRIFTQLSLYSIGCTRACLSKTREGIYRYCDTKWNCIFQRVCARTTGIFDITVKAPDNFKLLFDFIVRPRLLQKVPENLKNRPKNTMQVVLLIAKKDRSVPTPLCYCGCICGYLKILDTDVPEQSHAAFIRFVTTLFSRSRQNIPHKQWTCWLLVYLRDRCFWSVAVVVVLAWNKRALQEVGISEIGSFVGEGAGGRMAGI